MPSTSATATRSPRNRRYAMTCPSHFTVAYTINPWMDPNSSVNANLAVTQWENLRNIYLNLGHTVDLVPPVPGLPDMVYTANGGIIINGRTMGVQFTHPERAQEAPAYLQWMESIGLGPVHSPTHINEGEGDFLVISNRILAGTGFRTEPDAHHEVSAFFDMPVVTLELVDPHYYHLDTALTVLDDNNIAYYPDAFSFASQEKLRELYPDALIANTEDAQVLGLNAVSDGYNVILSSGAINLISTLKNEGYNPIPVDFSELLKGGGGVKCCTLEIRS
ncbi:MAG: dimethylargininase [Mycobacteriaceae bacterium]